MKRMGRTSLLSALLLALVVANAGLARPPALPRFFECELDASDVPALYGRATLRFSVTRTYDCREGTELTVEVKTSENLRCLGQRTWSFPHEPMARRSVDIVIDIPPDDTSYVDISMVCGKARDHLKRYFVTTGEKLEIWAGRPRRRAGGTKPTPPDTTKYEIRIDLREPFRLEHMRNVEEFLNEPLRADGDSGFYRFRADKRLIRKLIGEKFGVELLEEVPGLQVPPTETR